MHGQSVPVQGQAGPRQTAPTVRTYFYGSVVFSRRREGKRISLVTMAARFLRHLGVTPPSPPGVRPGVALVIYERMPLDELSVMGMPED
jgi:hypothetical protein